MEYYVYIIKSNKNNKFYIGQTSNINDRLKRHNNKENLSTKSGAPWKLVKLEEFESRAKAMKREKYLKSLKNKVYLQKIINDAGWSSSSSSGS